VEYAVVGGELIVGAVQSSFGAGAIVTADVDDERVVEFAFVLNLLDHAADLMIGIGGVSGEDLGLARIELLLDQRERVPPRQLCTTIRSLSFRPRGKLGIRRDHAKPLLVGEDLVAQLFVTHIKLALELIDPFPGWLMRRVAAAGHIVEKER